MKDEWTVAISDKHSTFTKLLQIPGLFVTQEQLLDMINLKIFALLMCPGSSKIKAEILYQMIKGPDPIDKGIAWRNPRLV